MCICVFFSLLFFDFNLVKMIHLYRMCRLQYICGFHSYQSESNNIQTKCEMLREKNDQHQTKAIKNVWAHT